MAPLVAWTPPPVPVVGRRHVRGHACRAARRLRASRASFRGPGAAHRPCRRPAARRRPVDHLVARGRRSLPHRRAGRPPARRIGRARLTAARPTRSARRARSRCRRAFRDFDLDLALAAYDREPLVVAAWEEGTATLTRAAPRRPLRDDSRRAQHARSSAAAASRVDRHLEAPAATASNGWRGTTTRCSTACGRRAPLRWPSRRRRAAHRPRRSTRGQVEDVGRAARAARGSGIDVSAALDEVHGPVDAGARRRRHRGRAARRRPLSSRPHWSLPTGAAGSAAADAVFDTETALVPRFELRAQGSRGRRCARRPGRRAGLTGAVAADVHLAAGFAGRG